MTIYFPLCKIQDVMEVVFRINGEVAGYEEYILNQYRWLYNRIPDSPAKRFADYQVMKMRSRGKRALEELENEVDEAWKSFRNSSVYELGSMQYSDIIDKTYSAVRDLSVNSILKDRIPEVYNVKKHALRNC